jgi:hypothetical protein
VSITWLALALNVVAIVLSCWATMTVRTANRIHEENLRGIDRIAAQDGYVWDESTRQYVYGDHP